ncbi:hypothetical protein RXV95_12475 [Novosphingobium sp. ZN18A2]|uniref:hypothetical protein n=1 Tax=Novosphingobium sp. ZN18A2 TaxID=3079861 RepID=UPI0030CF7DB9
MSGPATCSLSEAITALAFSDPTPAAMISDALNTQRWGGSTIALKKLHEAVNIHCDAGYKGEVRIWGRPITQSTGLDPLLGAPRRLTDAECLHNRLFAHLRDALRPGHCSGDEFDVTFKAEAIDGGFDEVSVDRDDLDKLRAASSRATSKAERECEVWLVEQFAADSSRNRRKPSFAAQAKEHFGTRLSARGFARAWATVAPRYGRDKSGRPKSNQNTM